MKGLTIFVSAVLLILIIFIIALVIGTWTQYTSAKILSDSYSGYVNKTKDLLGSIFRLFWK